MRDSAKTVEFLVRAGPAAAATARRAIREGDGVPPDGVREDVLLLVTELVTNAVRHAETGAPPLVRVAVHRLPERVRVEVVDGGPGFEPAPTRPGGPGGGWGLYVVDRVADRWGVVRAASGTCVWFEIDLSPPSHTAVDRRKATAHRGVSGGRSFRATDSTAEPRARVGGGIRRPYRCGRPASGASTLHCPRPSGQSPSRGPMAPKPGRPAPPAAARMDRAGRRQTATARPSRPT